MKTWDETVDGANRLRVKLSQDQKATFLEQQDCSHNLMVNNTDDDIGWHCSQCGHVETLEERAQLDDE